MARHAQRHAFLDPHGNAQSERLLTQELSIAPALGARRVNDAAAARAFRAGRDVLQADPFLTLGAHGLSAAPTLRTGPRLRAGLGARPLARLAGCRPLDMNRFLAAIEDAFEWNRDFNLDVVAAPRPRLSAKNAIEDSGPAKNQSQVRRKCPRS